MLFCVLSRAEIDRFDRLVAFAVLRCRDAHLITILEVAMEELELARRFLLTVILRLDVLFTVSLFDFQFTLASDLKPSSGAVSGSIVCILFCF